ncbi:MAG: hypothetical protein COU67_00290 [Candidatus Pacebacteria bacterium CG10_big_fil_rev_8_21_14_0_10_44_54]|nr:MAG: hypothetical protein COU67_00290 [Candidatus Pacebacteria bacterium CG10_big_fil_rev_8_21_14_0_10_44_54]
MKLSSLLKKFFLGNLNRKPAFKNLRQNLSKKPQEPKKSRDYLSIGLGIGKKYRDLFQTN